MNYYDENATEYIDKTINCDMQSQYDLLSEFANDGSLLDVGFGSARDMLYFKSKGFDVYGIDPTKAFCDQAKRLEFKVEQSTIEEYRTNKKFDVIWACASLLHCKNINKAFLKCYDLLNSKGVLYVSLKLGKGEEIIDGRFFHYVTQEELNAIIKACGFMTLKETVTKDSLSNRDVSWINAVLRKS